MSLPEPRPGDILDALNELGLISAAQARVSGDEVYVLCPYHEDRSLGSFSINIDTGMNSCFACGNGGSFHRYLMAAQHMSRQEARRWCLRRLIATTAPERPPQAQPDITEASLALFTEPPETSLAGRGITAAACRELGILWDPSSLSWIFPVHDPETGRLHGWQEKRSGRARNHPRGIPVKSCLFGWHLITPGSRVALVESPLDAAVMHGAGYPAVASFGSAVSADQLACITGRCSSLVLALDDDEAGWAATDRIWRMLHAIPVSIFNYGSAPGKDPGELDDEDIRWGMTNLLC